MQGCDHISIYFPRRFNVFFTACDFLIRGKRKSSVDPPFSTHPPLAASFLLTFSAADQRPVAAPSRIMANLSEFLPLLGRSKQLGGADTCGSAEWGISVYTVNGVLLIEM